MKKKGAPNGMQGKQGQGETQAETVLNEEKRGRGRPQTVITDEQWDALFKTISSTSKGIRKICAENEIPFDAAWSHIVNDNDFHERYLRAKELQAMYFSEEIIEIADDSTDDIVFIPSKDGKTEYPRVDNEAIKRSTLRVNARQWVMERLQPKKYGNKVEQTVQTPDGTNPFAITVQVIKKDE